jgi:hypothetical protein
METPTDDTRLGDPIEDTYELLEVIGAPRDWIKDRGDDPIEDRAYDVCDDYERLLRIIQLLLLTGRLDVEDALEAADAEKHLR